MAERTGRKRSRLAETKRQKKIPWRKGKAGKDEDEEDEDLDEDYEESAAQIIRKRSATVEKQRLSQQKMDKIVVVIAIAIVIGILGGYYGYLTYYAPTEDTSDDKLFAGEGPGNYTSTLNVISDVTHFYAKESWHLMNIGGYTSYMVRVDNTGTKEDNFKLTIENLDQRITVSLNKNNFKLKPNKSKLVIVNVSSSLRENYRMPTPIRISLISGYLQTVTDTITIDLTINDLNSNDVIKDGGKVQTYYTGAFENNGTLFDYSFSNPEANKPLFVSLSSDVQTDKFESEQYVPVIPGFRLGLIGMLPGETHVIVVPPELGYPAGQELGGMTLVFEVRLLKNDADA